MQLAKADEFVAEEVVMVSYEDLSARVVRANLECANGYIHVIDNVIMKVRSSLSFPNFLYGPYGAKTIMKILEGNSTCRFHR
jgi:hypothetical protein